MAILVAIFTVLSLKPFFEQIQLKILKFSVKAEVSYID